MCWCGFSKGCCSSLLLLSGSGFMLLLLLSAGEGLSSKGGLLRKSCVCVSVCSSADVSVDLCIYTNVVCLSVYVCFSLWQNWLATVSCRYRSMERRGQTCWNSSSLLFSCSYSFCLLQSTSVLSLYASLFSFVSALIQFPSSTLLQQQGAVLGGMTLKCSACGYIMGAGGWAMPARHSFCCLW